MKIKNELLEKRAHLVRLIHKIFGDVAARTFVATAVCLRLPQNPAYDTNKQLLLTYLPSTGSCVPACDAFPT
jgi:hypothetical protein